jgi:hypothetical protein
VETNNEIPVVIIPLTEEEELEREVYLAGQHERDLEAVAVLRRAAYTQESDPLAFKYQETELPEDKAAWLAKKAEIQERYPEPVAPKAKKK